MTSIRRIITHLARQNPSPNTLRWCSTSTETAAPVAANKNFLFERVKLLIERLKQSGYESSISEILNEYQNEGNDITKFDVVSLGKYFRNRNNFKSARQLYDWVESNKMLVTNADRAVHINVLYKTEGLASAENYFNDLQESERTDKTYGALLSCYSREKSLDKTLEIFEKMTTLNLITVLNYNNLLSLYYYMEQPEKVVSLFQEMKENSQIKPDIYTYNLLMNSYVALGNLDAVAEVLEEMGSKNIKLDSFTCGNLATMHAKFGLQEEAKTYLEMMEKINIQNKGELAQAAYTRLKLYSEMSDISGVNRAWEFLKSNFPTVSNTNYLMMFMALSRLGDLERLEALYKDWEEHGSGVFDFRLPTVLLEYYINHNMIEKATAMHEDLVSRGIDPSPRALNAYTILCIKNSQMGLALKYLEIGVDKDGGKHSNWFPTEETIKLFVDYFKETDDKDGVEKFIQIMKKVDRLDSSLYDSLLSDFNASTSEF